MTQGNSIKFFIFLCFFNQNILFFASQRREHVPKPRDEEARACSPSSLSSSVIYGSDLGSSSVSQPQPRPIKSLAEPDLFNSQDSSNRSPSYNPETSPSMSCLSNATLSQNALLEKQNELAQCSHFLITRYCNQVIIGFSQFRNMLNDYKKRDHSRTTQEPGAASNHSTIISMQRLITKNLPDHIVKLVIPQQQNPHCPASLTAVEKNKILLYPAFFKLKPTQQEAELQFAIANIKADDYYLMNIMHHYYAQISSILEEKKQNEIENLLEVYQFVRIQSAFIQAMLSTENMGTHDVLQKQYQQLMHENKVLAQQVHNLNHDPAISARISDMVAKTKQYLTERDAQKAQKDRELALQKQALEVQKQSGQKRKRKN